MQSLLAELVAYALAEPNACRRGRRLTSMIILNKLRVCAHLWRRSIGLTDEFKALIMTISLDSHDKWLLAGKQRPAALILRALSSLTAVGRSVRLLSSTVPAGK